MENLLNKESQFKNELVENFILNKSTLIADNLATYFKYYQSDNKFIVDYEMIVNSSSDEFILSNERQQQLNNLIIRSLKERHKLKLVKNAEDLVILEKYDNC